LDAQRIGRIFGWLFIGTFVTSIPARLLFIDGLGASWTDTIFNPGGLSDASLRLGSILEFGVIVTNIATAVVIYPLMRRHSATLGLGYVTARIMESAFIAIGLISIIAVMDVNDAWTAASGAEAAALQTQGNTLVSLYDWAFQFGPGLVVGFGNGLMLGYLMYRSGLVPRRMAILGLIGGPMLILSFVLIVFGAYENGSTASSLMALPEIAWEVSLGIYCASKGFKPNSVVEPEMAMHSRAGRGLGPVQLRSDPTTMHEQEESLHPTSVT
jgi:hypothetical protein